MERDPTGMFLARFPERGGDYGLWLGSVMNIHGKMLRRIVRMRPAPLPMAGFPRQVGAPDLAAELSPCRPGCSAPAVALKCHRENNPGKKKKKSFLGGSMQQGSIPGGSQHVSPPATRPPPHSSPGWRRNPCCADGPAAPRCSSRAALPAPRRCLPAPRPSLRGHGGAWVRSRVPLGVCPCVPVHRSLLQLHVPLH